ASLVSTTAWTSGQLDNYLGLTGAPTNPIGAYLPTTKFFDSGATGYFVYTANVGPTKIWDNAQETKGPTFDLSSIPGLSGDFGAYIVAFCSPITGSTDCTEQNGKSIVATANSGALLVNGDRRPPNFTPEPTTLALLGILALGFGLARGRKGH